MCFCQISGVVLLLSVAIASSKADVWQQFRGDFAGKLQKIEHPLTWSSETNLAWAAPIKGSGWSAPVILGDRIFVTAAESDDGTKPKGMEAGVASMRSFRSAKPGKHRFVVSCLSLDDGRLLWTRNVGEAIPPTIHPSNTYATESPATDGQRIFTFFATTGTLCAWNLDGVELWRRELGAYRAGNGFGTGSSLACHQGRVFLQYDNDENSFLAAMDSSTGEELWRDQRPPKTSWSSPLVWSHGGGLELIACGSDIVTSYDLTNGAVVWRVSGMKSGFSGSPAMDSERVYFGTSGPTSAGPLVAVKRGARGDIALDNKFQSDRVDWSRIKSGPGMASPVVSNGHLFIPGSGGILNCYDVESGDRVYRTRVPHMATVVASLWADENRVFILDESGTTHVIASGPNFELLASNKLDDLCWSTPTIAGDTLLIRGVENLYCIRK